MKTILVLVVAILSILVVGCAPSERLAYPYPYYETAPVYYYYHGYNYNYNRPAIVRYGVHNYRQKNTNCQPAKSYNTGNRTRNSGASRSGNRRR